MQIARYLGKISGPLLDRIDLQVEVPALNAEEIGSTAAGEASSLIRDRVETARQIQRERFRRSQVTARRSAILFLSAGDEGSKAVVNALRSIASKRKSLPKLIYVIDGGVPDEAIAFARMLDWRAGRRRLVDRPDHGLRPRRRYEMLAVVLEVNPASGSAEITRRAARFAGIAIGEKRLAVLRYRDEEGTVRAVDRANRSRLERQCRPGLMHRVKPPPDGRQIAGTTDQALAISTERGAANGGVMHANSRQSFAGRADIDAPDPHRAVLASGRDPARIRAVGRDVDRRLMQHPLGDAPAITHPPGMRD
jgi:hypothetical protein